jgi:hypothetical protein
MRESLAMAFRDKDMLLPPIFSVFASTGFLVAAVLVLRAMGLLHKVLSEEEGWNATQIATLLVVGFVYFGIIYFFTGMVVHMVDKHLKGQDARLGEAFADSVRNIGAILLLAVVSSVISLLTSGRRRRSEGLPGQGYDGADIAARLAWRVWMVAVSLALPIIILEDMPFRRAWGRAKEIYAGNLLPIAIGEIGVIVVGRVIGFVGAVIAAAGVLWAFTVGRGAILIPSLIAGGLFLAVVMAYTNFMRTAYYTCLYLWAVERAAAGEQAAVPKPIAAALEMGT